MNMGRPQRRETSLTEGKGSVFKRGDGLGTGPTGSGRPGGGGGGPRSGRGGFSSILMIILALLFGGGAGLSGLFGGSDDSYSEPSSNLYYSDTSTHQGWTSANSNVSQLDTTVASGSRNKYTKIAGNGKDTVTIMVYMCGADLESQNGMATADLREMLSADLSDNINIVVYTGGSTYWRTKAISARTNQVWEVKNNKLYKVAEDGDKVMTDPNTLSAFIRYCGKNYKADRYELILWDHGNGTAAGYGYDEKHRRAGSMTLDGIDTALKNGGVKFDFVGFDACLMATVENGLMLDKYADYMIASEETEPGIGWYYTDWLNALSKNTSMPTIEIGKNIVDSFVERCARQCTGQKTTLSVVDLAELSNTVPPALSDFSIEVSNTINNKGYKSVASARNQTRSFATSTRIDQVDLTDLADKVNNSKSDALEKAVKGAVKYNRTSTNMSNSYGLSVYFPYQKLSTVDSVVRTYDAIGMNAEYSKCIRDFATYQATGQAGTQYSSQPGTLFGTLTGEDPVGYSSSDMETLFDLFFGGDYGSVGLNDSNSFFLSGRSIPQEDLTNYVESNHLDDLNLVWKKSGDNYVMNLSEDQWGLVQSIDQSVYYDDGEGYINLGLDNNYDFDEKGNLIATTDRTWLCINKHVIPYFHTDTTVEEDGNYTITGYVPAILNGEQRVNLILVFTKDNPNGSIAGAQYVYDEADTSTVAKNLIELEVGDTLDFICDFYAYDGTYQDSYFLGDQLKVTEDMEIRNIELDGGKVSVVYRFTDIYNQQHYSQAIEI